MDLNALYESMRNCECGCKHECDLKAFELGSGILLNTGKILKENGFSKRLLMVADGNSFRVTKGLYESLLEDGFVVELRVYDDMRVADQREVDELRPQIRRVDGVLSVGTGSVNDICRYASFLEDKPLAIVATAPSMDGFASDSAPITKDGFKASQPCRQPVAIIADTKILAQSPNELKSAGFGDVMAKFIALVDWRVANILHGDYYCERVATLVRDALKRMVSLADKVTTDSEEAASAVMETLVMTGIAMQLAKCTRPASGTEHIISHFWECKKLEKGIISDFHGKKVAVATLVVTDIYHKLASIPSVKAQKENIDWKALEKAYGKNLLVDVEKFNLPHSIVDEIDPSLIEKNWQRICEIIKEEMPTLDEMIRIYDLAGAAKTNAEIAVDDDLADEGITYHVYMRRRVTLMRLLPMLNLDALQIYKSDKK